MHGFYFLYKRNLKSGTIYYYKAYRPDGSLSSGKTTGCRSKRLAKIYCDTLLKEGKLSYTSDCTFAQYATHFFDDDSIWVMDRKSLGTADRPAISASYLKKLQRTVKIHLLPYFGKKRLNSITPADIKAYRLQLLNDKGLSCKSINDTVSVFKTIIENAVSENKVTVSPLRGIKPLMRNAAPREAFTIEDAKQVLKAEWKNPAHKLFSFVGAVTGMRYSEILAIRKENLHETYIDLKDQILNGKPSPLKTKEARKIPICPELYEVLHNRISDEFVFSEIKDAKASDSLRELLVKIMPERKKERGYCFHSWRHFFNTYLLSQGVPPIKVASVMGHFTGISSMQERYTNFTEADYQEVYEKQRQLFNELKYW